MTIPDGFQLCPKGVSCPSCKSPLIKKMPTEVTVTEVKAADCDAEGSNTFEITPTFDYAALQTSLESARCANLLLQAMSFDAATREKERLEADEGGPAPVSGVSYCPECKVHVITEPTELATLFDKVATNGDETTIEETLRGRLYVCVSEDDVTSLANRKEQVELACSYDIITPTGSDLPVRAMDFDYEYRHGIATKAMGRRITKGYALLEELCASCEMPLMQPPQSTEKECVVCPKLEKMLTKFTSSEGLPKFKLETNPTEDSLFQIDEDDPVSLIIAEARRAIKATSSTANSDEPISARSKVEEAKQFLSSKRRADTDDQSNAKSKDTQPLTPDPSQTENATAMPVDWDQLLATGRSLLSERLQQGWILSNENCSGRNCKNTPLMSKEGEPHVCTVCGGCGNGLDGAYAVERGDGPTIVQWEDLVTNGRAILAERLKQGWVMSSENCNGVNCRGTPLTQYEDGPLSCVVCGGSGSGFDGAYAFLKSDEVLEAERALVSLEISYLMSLGWTLRDSLCEKCQMPLVAEHVDAEDVCILCGKNPLNSFMNGPAMMGTSPQCFDDNANEAGQRLMLGWRLGDASPLCPTCGGIQMMPPNSTECGCINRACPKVLPAALASNPGCHLPAYENIVPQAHQASNAEVLKNIGSKISGKLSISSLLKDGLVPLMVCGAPDYSDDQSALSDDMSMVRSATSNALGAILARLDQAKYQLELLRENGQYTTEEAVMKQAEVAMLIEKLANAAVAMKQMEEIDAREPPLAM
ncbi:hypothetical protein HJC23_001604 [Cyclotella cryptica]|uniref:Uncharacterized protein n=1 Tax=Cyclotella cryptica TaxID=29204 RepID=A0ABD3P1Z9_9STRA|eukprot:CCRYP_018522-RA/>CCRYP_018522-RA protein AED:0.37 eAED:0.37 QI:246/1/1/1/0/0/2/488/760